MKIVSLDKHTPSLDTLTMIAARLREGAVVIVPTDTVYGVSVAVLEGTTPKRLYEIKGRDATKAIACLVSGIQALTKYGEHVPDYALRLAEKYWPGALTLVVNASRQIPKAFRAQDGSIALRMPAHPIALSLVEQLGVPLATSSANLQGKDPAQDMLSLDPQLISRADLVIDAGAVLGAIPSTIVSCLGDRPQIIREGALARTGILIN